MVDLLRFVGRLSFSLSGVSSLLISVHQHGAQSGHKVVSLRAHFLQSLNLMSICSRSVDGLLMSKNCLFLIIFYMEDFKVGNLDGFSLGWSGGRSPKR